MQNSTTTTINTYSEKQVPMTSSKSRVRSSSQSGTHKRLLHHVGGALGELMGQNMQSGEASSQMVQMALGLLQSYNMRTDSRGGLTDQILNGVESLLVNGISSNEFAQNAEKIVKVLLTAFAAKGLLGSKTGENADTNQRKLARAAKAMAIGVLAKKVVDDLLNRKAPASQASKTAQVKDLLLNILEKQVKRGKSQASGLESDSSLGSLMVKARALARDQKAKTAGDVESKSKYSNTVMVFAQQLLKDESTNAFLASKASKYGVDSRLALQAKELFIDFDMDKAISFAKGAAMTYLDKSSTRAEY